MRKLLGFRRPRRHDEDAMRFMQTQFSDRELARPFSRLVDDHTGKSHTEFVTNEEVKGMSRRNFIRYAGLLGIGAAAAGALADRFVFPQTHAVTSPTIPWYQEGGSMVMPPSYLGYIDSSGPTYMARNGTNGRNDYKETDPAKLIMDTINALTIGGSIQLKNGRYDLTNSVFLNTTDGNCLIQFPKGVTTPVTGANPTPVFEMAGETPAPGPMATKQTETISTRGVLLDASGLIAGAPAVSPSIIGLSNGVGLGYGVFYNTCVALRNLNIITHPETGASTVVGINMLMPLHAYLEKCSVQMNSPLDSMPQPTGGSFGVVMPGGNNYAMQNARDVFVAGFSRGMQVTEDTELENVYFNYCYYGLEILRANHVVYGHKIFTPACTYPISAPQAPSGLLYARLCIDNWETEDDTAAGSGGWAATVAHILNPQNGKWYLRYHRVLTSSGEVLTPLTFSGGNLLPGSVVAPITHAVAASTITVGASPFTYTNNDGYPEVVIVQGGTVSSITYGDAGTPQNITVVNGAIYVGPGNKIVVTYSVAPALYKFPQKA